MSDHETQHFEIFSAEGLPIRGAIAIPKNPERLAIVVHGFKGFREWGFFPWLCERLAASGIVACRFDMSRNGIGDDPESFDRLDLFADDTYSIQLADLEAVVQHVRRREGLGALPTFLVGHSRGGAVALLGASKITGIAGVATWSAIADLDRWSASEKAAWRRDGHLAIENARTGQTMRMSTAILDDLERTGLDVIEAVRSLKIPAFIVHGADDETVSSEDARRIAEAHRDASLLLISGASHTYNAIHPLVNVSPELELAAHVTARFITTYR